MTKLEILELVGKVHSLKKSKENTLPNNSYFLSENEILCYPNENGDSRYPYHKEGLVLFAHSDGYLDCVEGAFNLFKCANYNEDTPIAFFAGEKFDGGFFPYSITGAARQLFESNAVRYTVFTPICVYYITETEGTVYAVKAFVNDQKNLRFSVGAINLSDEKEIYLCAYFEPTLRDHPYEDFFKRMTKYGCHYDNGGYIIKTRYTNVDYNYLAINVSLNGEAQKRFFTTAKGDVLGLKGSNLTNSTAFKNGYFKKQTVKTNTTDFPVAADMVHFALRDNDFAELEFELHFTQNEAEALAFVNKTIDYKTEEEYLKEKKELEDLRFQNAKIAFGGWHNDKLHSNVVNSFLQCVKRQVSFCALSKNYAGPNLGIRDVFQQLESSLLWDPVPSRKQIVRVMNYILEDGRPPRQIAFPINENTIPKMDLRPFIDQGFWIISTLYTYLSFTDDYSILDEICRYFKVDKTYGPVRFTDQKDSVLRHLIRITDFLVSNIDAKTNCIHALFGDWNDALDGLGRTSDKTKEFGNGVSVMATLQLYLALGQMCEILTHIGCDNELVKRYENIRQQVLNGIKENAIVKDQNGKSRIVHGWGEDMSYFVGSYDDYDGKSRISLTTNAFYAISGLGEAVPEIKDDIAENIISLDSKYGLKTFDEAFIGFANEIGRLSTITQGTYENACAYVHAGTFGAMALFMMGYSKEAWSALEKAMVISHENATMSTFVMPNSYCFDNDYGFDGESMGDWYTGSGTVLIKNIIKGAFGIEPNLKGLKLSPAGYFPSKNAEISLKIKGFNVTVKYRNLNNKSRKITLNGNELPLVFDNLRNIHYAEIEKAKLTDNALIVVTD